jgi:hypothetical protein
LFPLSSRIWGCKFVMILVIVVRVIIGIWSKTCSNENVTYLVLVYDGIIFVIDDYISCWATDPASKIFNKASTCTITAQRCGTILQKNSSVKHQES